MSDVNFSTEETKAIFDKHGYTFGGLLASSRAAFDRAYADGQANGFDPDLSIQEGSDVRVHALYDALQETYGSLDLKSLGSLAIISALGLTQQLQEVLNGFEAFANAKPSDFQRAETAIKAQNASVLGAGVRI